MKRQVRMVLAALVLILAIAGCSSKTTSPAASSAPSSASSTSAETTTSEKSSTSTTETSTAVVPAPANSLTITCKDWRDLDDPTQLAVVTAIVTEPGFKGAVTDPDNARLAAKAGCLLFSSKTVKDVLLTGS